VTTEPRAYVRHCRQVPSAARPYCMRGWRDFFARQGWDWPTFLREGIPCATLEASGQAPAIALAARAREAS
jgi:hypothetical protein